MTSLIMAAIGVAMLALCVISVRLVPKVGAVAVGVAVILVGLAYDNFAVAIGRFVGYGDTLLAINMPRFWIHAIVTPLLIVVAGILVGRLGVTQAQTRNVAIGGWALVAMLILIGVVEEIVKARLVPENAGDALRYVNAEATGAPLPAIITVLALLVLGVMAWRYAGFPWLFIGSMVMLIAAAAGNAVLWVGNLGELVLMSSVVVTMAAIGGVRVPLAPSVRHSS
ncbi:hypothetical protein [Gordonia insulae]|uniref:Uncharacterized protein n=1 Tax=Gordonia insulae TaxID=2420509 RepID=A0A3G8JPH5_9ACTN|nr:hypothetical protein [Gordonia insulae]AZG46060.1 hypothetical protein D7316_02660 [Gordonia insulae]